MIETRRFKNVIFIQTILSFVLSRKIIQNGFTILKWLRIQSQKKAVRIPFNAHCHCNETFNTKTLKLVCFLITRFVTELSLS